MAEEVTKTRVELEQPYRTAGILSVLASFVILGFTLGVLSRCGNGSGICLDYATHAAGDAGLILFVMFLIVGVALIAYTGSATSYSTRTVTPVAPAPPATTVVLPQSAAASPAPVTNVFPSTTVAPGAPAVTPSAPATPVAAPHQ
jgi:hypothetical protein